MGTKFNNTIPLSLRELRSGELLRPHLCQLLLMLSYLICQVRRTKKPSMLVLDLEVQLGIDLFGRLELGMHFVQSTRFFDFVRFISRNLRLKLCSAMHSIGELGIGGVPKRVQFSNPLILDRAFWATLIMGFRDVRRALV